jgi:hypothetical protein
MYRIIAAVLCLAFTSPAFAATAQQAKMKDCNAKAAGMKGDDRKAFMSKCLKGTDAPAPAATTQQKKMKDCNAKAAGKKGDERKKFMSECLKG